MIRSTESDITIDDSGTITAKHPVNELRYSYDVWGACTISADTSGCGIAAMNPFRYRGYYFDAEIGMYYLQSRFYDPQVVRFVNADYADIVSWEERGLSVNLFSYCHNNSVMLQDDGGMFSFSDLYKKITGFLKKLFEKFVAKLKNQLKITRTYIKIGVSAIKLLIDLVLSLVVNQVLKWGIEKLIGYAMKKYIQNSPKTFVKYIGKILNHSATKWLIKKLLLKAVNPGYIRSVNNFVKDIAIDSVLSSTKVLSKINSICSVCSSISGFIAFIVDLADGKWDDYLKIKFA